MKTMTNGIGMKLTLIPNDSFYMGMHQITQRQYQEVMGTNPSWFKWEDRPVEMVSWHDAMAFCDKLSEREGKAYRLPTEAEWEYACRAGTNTTPFYFGGWDANALPYCVYKNTSCGWTNPVGTKQPNAWGLYDMHGNVWEWCLDLYEPYKGKTQREYRITRGGAWDSPLADCYSSAYVWTPSCFSGCDIGFRVVCEV